MRKESKAQPIQDDGKPKLTVNEMTEMISDAREFVSTGRITDKDKIHADSMKVDGIRAGISCETAKKSVKKAKRSLNNNKLNKSLKRIINSIDQTAHCLGILVNMNTKQINRSILKLRTDDDAITVKDLKKFIKENKIPNDTKIGIALPRTIVNGTSIQLVYHQDTNIILIYEREEHVQ